MSASKSRTPTRPVTPANSPPADSAGPDHDPDPDAAYARWREMRLKELDEDYAAWRATGHTRFPPDFDAWRRARRELIAEQLTAGRPLTAASDDAPEGDKLGL